MTSLELIVALIISAGFGSAITHFFHVLVDRSAEMEKFREETKEKNEVIKIVKQNDKEVGIEFQEKSKDEVIEKEIIEAEKEKNEAEKNDILEVIEEKKDEFSKKEIPLTDKDEILNPYSASIYHRTTGVNIDNLQVVDGIGPKIEKILKENKINNLNTLAKTKPEKIKYILETVGGEKYSFHNPASWPNQARIYLEKGEEELKEYQEFLRAKKMIGV